MNKVILVWSDDHYSELLLKDLIKQSNNSCYIKILYFLYDTSKTAIGHIAKLTRNTEFSNIIVESICCELNYPANNFTKLAIAVNIADDIDFNKVAYAVHKEECYGSPQDRMLFLQGLNTASTLGTKNNVGIYTPYIDMTPVEIHEKLGIKEDD